MCCADDDEADMKVKEQPAFYIQRGVPRRDLIPEIVLFLFWLATISVAAFLEPNVAGHGTHTQIGFPPCPWQSVYARPCPTCGMTTAWAAMLNGDFALAIRAHLFGPAVFLWFAVGSIYYGSKFVFRYRMIAPVKPILTANLLFLAAFIGYGIWRMIP